MIAIIELFADARKWVAMANRLRTKILTADGQYCGTGDEAITPGQQYLLQRGLATPSTKRVSVISLVAFLLPRRFVLPFLYVLCALRAGDKQVTLGGLLDKIMSNTTGAEKSQRVFIKTVVEERQLQDVFSGVVQIKNKQVTLLLSRQIVALQTIKNHCYPHKYK